MKVWDAVQKSGVNLDIRDNVGLARWVYKNESAAGAEAVAWLREWGGADGRAIATAMEGGVDPAHVHEWSAWKSRNFAYVRECACGASETRENVSLVDQTLEQRGLEGVRPFIDTDDKASIGMPCGVPCREE